MALLRALVVDNRLVARLYVQAVLSVSGFDCVTVSNDRGAQRYASPNGIDLIVARIEATVHDGVDLLKLVKDGRFGATPPPVLVHSQKRDAQSSILRMCVYPPATRLSGFCPRSLMATVRQAFGEMESAVHAQ
jgi:DNA-binding response OmpR family regulator